MLFGADHAAAEQRRQLVIVPAECAVRRAVHVRHVDSNHGVELAYGAAWFDAEDIRPRVVGEFDDSALMKAFGQEGRAAFPAPTAIQHEIVRQYRVRPIGRVKTVRERYYAISVERRLKHPGVLAITHAAKRDLFGKGTHDRLTDT